MFAPLPQLYTSKIEQSRTGNPSVSESDSVFPSPLFHYYFLIVLLISDLDVQVKRCYLVINCLTPSANCIVLTSQGFGIFVMKDLITPLFTNGGRLKMGILIEEIN